MDVISNLLFALAVAYYPNFIKSPPLFFIFMASVFFILIPSSISLFQLNQMIDGQWNKSEEMRSYLSSYKYTLYILSIVCFSSFTGVQICQSNLFGHLIFDIPLSKQEALYFEAKKIYSIVLFQVLVIVYKCSNGHMW